MPEFRRKDTTIYYEVYGEGYPVVLFAPGGMRSSIDFWKKSEWNPITTLSSHFKVIAMDQRNAGKSTAPINATDSWRVYTEDHIALLDYLGIDSCHLLGGCIGGPYCLGIIKADPKRVGAVVLQQSIGADNNKDAFYGLFDSWAEEIKHQHPKVTEEEWNQFRSNMFDGDFVYNVDRHFVSQIKTSMLVLMGNDVYHPEIISREIAELAPNAKLIEEWKNPKEDNTIETVIQFFKENTPVRKT